MDSFGVKFSFLRYSRSRGSSYLVELTKPLFSIIFLHFVDKYRVIDYLPCRVQFNTKLENLQPWHKFYLPRIEMQVEIHKNKTTKFYPSKRDSKSTNPK